MTLEVKTWNGDFMEEQSENESLRAKIREIEDENQELRTQNLIQNRTISEMRHEMILMRIQMQEMSDTSALLTGRVRELSQNLESQRLQQENDEVVGQITAPPLMAPPAVPPPLPPSRIRITPRQVGAGEALTTPLGVSLSSSYRHRVKRDSRQGFYRPSRSPPRRQDSSEPGPSTPASTDRPNYFVGLRIIPQFQTSFVCAQNDTSEFSDSASDSSESDDNIQMMKNVQTKVSNEESGFKRATTFARDLDLLKNVRNLHQNKVRQTILQNYGLSMKNTGSKFFFPLRWESQQNGTVTMPSTSRNEVRFSHSINSNKGEEAQASGTVLRNPSKISDCTQYTFPAIHEGLHHNGVSPMITASKQSLRLRKFKKNIPYIKPDEKKSLEPTKNELDSNEHTIRLVNEKNRINLEISNSQRLNSGSMNSAEEIRASEISQGMLLRDFQSDFEQDGFQADESSNCATSNENSLEKICISESNMERKN